MIFGFLGLGLSLSFGFASFYDTPNLVVCTRLLYLALLGMSVCDLQSENLKRTLLHTSSTSEAATDTTCAYVLLPFAINSPGSIPPSSCVWHLLQSHHVSAIAFTSSRFSLLQPLFTLPDPTAQCHHDHSHFPTSASYCHRKIPVTSPTLPFLSRFSASSHSTSTLLSYRSPSTANGPHPSTQSKSLYDALDLSP